MRRVRPASEPGSGPGPGSGMAAASAARAASGRQPGPACWRTFFCVSRLKRLTSIFRFTFVLFASNFGLDAPNIGATGGLAFANGGCAFANTGAVPPPTRRVHSKDWDIAEIPCWSGIAPCSHERARKPCLPPCVPRVRPCVSAAGSAPPQQHQHDRLLDCGPVLRGRLRAARHRARDHRHALRARPRRAAPPRRAPARSKAAPPLTQCPP